jgi:large subunit ribosomal protein L21
MYAIVEIAGQQFKVEKGQEIFVHHLGGKKGAKQEFEKVLLLDDKGKVMVGNPTVAKAKVTAKVVEHVKGDKVIVFKKKKRKGYQKSNGHRQQFTKIKIDNITVK